MAKSINYRTFLEPPSQNVDSYVQVTGSDEYIDLIVADCGNRVTLGFSLRTWSQTKAQWERQRGIKLAKVAKLEKALALIREQLETIEYERDND